MAAAANTTFGQFSEQPFDQVQPDRAGRSEVHAIAGMSSDPVSDLGDLVGALVVHDDVHFGTARKGRVDLGQELQELLMTVAAVTGANGFAGLDVQRREQ